MKLKLTLFGVAGLLAAASASKAAVVLTEDFEYPNGPLVGATGSPWATHSGTAAQVTVTGGAAIINGTASEDVNSAFSATNYTTGVLSSTFTATFSALPGATAAYFAHYKDTTTGFTARLFATTTGAAAGSFRLGIQNTGVAIVYSTVDLSLATTYAISLNYDLDLNSSSFSIDGGEAVVASDVGANVGVSAFALRQSGGIGTIAIDNLVVSYVVPEPATALLGALGFVGMLRRRR